MILTPLLFAATVYALGITWVVRIVISYRHILRARSATIPTVNHVHFDILLPVLQEDKRLKEFVKYFEKSIRPVYSDFTVWIITTEQELTIGGKPITWHIADRLSASRSYIKRIHYPKAESVMAHQLNFALTTINSKGMYVVYNADSRPDLQTFDWVNQSFQSLSIKKRLIFQQYGNYLHNYKRILSGRWRQLLLANALHQNRCTLGYEYYKALQGMARINLPAVFKPVNYCIGHGLFFTSDLGRTMRFSESTRNEDCIYGLEATWRKVPIIPVPYFDLSDSTSSMGGLYYQKSNWYFGPFQAFLYTKILLKKYNLHSNISLSLFSLKLFMQSIGWIFWPLLGLGLTVYGLYLIVAGDSILNSLVLVTALPFYLVPTSIIGYIVIRKLNTSVDNNIPPLRSAFNAILFGAVPNYIINGIAGLRGLLFYGRIVNSQKGKTPVN